MTQDRHVTGKEFILSPPCPPMLRYAIMWLWCSKKKKERGQHVNFLFSSITASVAEKNLPNGTETLGNLKTADYELQAF